MDWAEEQHVYNSAAAVAQLLETQHDSSERAPSHRPTLHTCRAGAILDSSVHLQERRGVPKDRDIYVVGEVAWEWAEVALNAWQLPVVSTFALQQFTQFAIRVSGIYG